LVPEKAGVGTESNLQPMEKRVGIGEKEKGRGRVFIPGQQQGKPDAASQEARGEGLAESPARRREIPEKGGEVAEEGSPRVDALGERGRPSDRNAC